MFPRLSKEATGGNVDDEGDREVFEAALMPPGMHDAPQGSRDIDTVPHV